MSVKKGKRWSQRVTERSNALDLESGVLLAGGPPEHLPAP